MSSQEIALRGTRRRPRTRTVVTFLVMFLAGVLAFSSGAAWAFWHAGTTAGSNGSSAATSVGGGSTPTATAAGTTVTVSWTASTLATGAPVSGYRVTRYDATTLTAQTALSGCAGTVSSLTCVESAVPTGSWKYSITPVFATNWTGAESGKSATLAVDGVPPTNSLTATNVSGGAFLVGTTVYYRGGRDRLLHADECRCRRGIRCCVESDLCAHRVSSGLGPCAVDCVHADRGTICVGCI